MKTSICPQCGKEFSYYPSGYDTGEKIHCSRKCQSEAARAWTKCPECGKEFWYHKSSPRKYCSRRCSAANNAVANLGTWASGVSPVEVTCETCGKRFTKPYQDLKKTKHNFCSLVCFGKFLTGSRKGIPRPEVRGEKPSLQKRVTKVCPHCGKEFKVKQSHADRRLMCSKECQRTASRVEKTCKQCGKQFFAKKSTAHKNKFCSRRCQGNYQRTLTGPLAHNWRGGYEPYYGDNWEEQRRKARKRDNYTCQHCGITEGEYRQEMDVHHIVPRRLFNGDNKRANRLSNLITLCMSCHRRAEPKK